MYREMINKLTPRLRKLHKCAHNEISAYKQPLYCLPIITEHIFEALQADPELAKRDLSDTELPHKLVLRDRLLGELTLSRKTFKVTGRMLNYYILNRKTVRNYAELRNNISRTFKAELSYDNLKYIRLFNLAQIALDVHVPLEVLIYGTTDTKQIALYNYVYFNHLTKYEHAYLLLQSRYHKPIYNCINKYIRPYDVTYQEIASKCGVSRQSVSQWLNKPYKFSMVQTQATLTKLCNIAGLSPVQLLRYRRVSIPRLHKYTSSYIKQLRYSPGKRWLNEPIKWNPDIKKKRTSQK